MQKTIGLKVVAKVNGFHRARRKAYALIQAGICYCTDCDQPATQIHWVDQAEWYPYCDDHHDPHQQWVGHTNWESSELVMRVIPDRARTWYENLTPEQREGIKLIEYDATDYYSLVVSWTDYTTITLGGSNETFAHDVVKIYQLTTGWYVYEHVKRIGTDTRVGPLIGAFESIDEATRAAMTHVEA